MGRNRESRTGIAVLAFIVASTAAQFNSPADLRDDCTDKTDGIYPTGHCSTYFLECSSGRTTKQNCSAGLWFNPQSSQCDYRENIVACQDPFSCIGREDGVYGEGCSSMFWYCSGGQLEHSICPDGTFYSLDSQKCDFRHKIKACGGDPKATSAPNTRSNRLITSPTTTQPTTMQPIERDSTEVPYGQTYPTYAPRQRISGTVSKTPLDESSAGTACAGKEDGSHATNKCSGRYVLCWAGTGSVMNCQKGLLFNEVTGRCDYPLNVADCSGSPSVSQDETGPSVYGGVLSAAPSTASLPIPRQPIESDCSTLSDGVYGSSCTRDFFQCVNGVAYAKSCTEGLVYNAEKKQCDYKENCGSITWTLSSDATTTVTPIVATAETTIDFDCSSLPDGSYSRGCITHFYQCSSGRAILQKCPDGLVFDDFTKACDYPQICSAPHSTASLDSVANVYSRPSSTSIPTTSTSASFDCSSRVDGLYSEGCVSSFFQCSSGAVSSYLCPDGLVFDGVSQRCDFPDRCGQPRPLDEESPVYLQSVPSDYTHNNLPQRDSIAFDCSSRSDGSYGDSCTSSFIQCVAGMAYSQQCPQGLVFHLKTGNCDYPEKCDKMEDAVEVPVVESLVQPVKPTLTPAAIDCFNRADGVYSSGCSRTYVQCANGMAFNQLCPEGLVFIQETRICDYPSSCEIRSSDAPSLTPYAPSTPSSSPYIPSIDNETPSSSTTLPPMRDQPSGVLIDCATLADGSYTSGCTHAFVQCANGAAIPLECPAGLVFDQRVKQCVWPESCSTGYSPSLPTVSLPIRPSDVPSTVYDMKEEKEEMVTDAPLPEVRKDGSVCTGRGRRAMGKCSSGFVQCIGGKMIARRCPGQSLFDEKIGLCVYDLDGCEMDVDVVDVSDQESTVEGTVAAQENSSEGYNRQPMESSPSYPQQTVPQTDYQEYSQSSQEQYYQNGYPTQAAPPQYQSSQSSYQSAPAPDYSTTGYQSVAQDGQYQSASASVPVYSSFDDPSLASQWISSPECEIGSFRRVSACSSSFDACSPTARQWIRRLCGKSHRFDSLVNRCRPIFEIRECDEPMSSYVPPPVQSEAPAVYPNAATSFENGVALSGREYQEKHVVDPFKGGYQSGMMGSNPFVAVGNTGSFYTDDGFRWVGSAWSEGGEMRRGGKRHHKQRDGHHSGDYVIVSGNPFGAGRDRELNDEWEGRRSYDGPVRSSLTSARGDGVRNVHDNFKGRVSHFAPPLAIVNPFAVKRGDGVRRRGRKSCRRDKHRRRDDWEEEEDCEEERELERPTERSFADENEEERGTQMEEESRTKEDEENESVDESPVESEAKELEENGEETEETETDPELLPESIDEEESKEIEDGVNEEEKNEENEETEEVDENEEKTEEEGENDVKEETEGSEEEKEETDGTEEGNEETEEVGGVNEVEKTGEDTPTMKGRFEEVDEMIGERNEEEDDDDDEEEENDDGSTEQEEISDRGDEEEGAEGETEEEAGETERAEEEVKEDEEEKEGEIEEDGEPTEESKTEDVDAAESEEKNENEEVKEETTEEIEKDDEEIEDPENGDETGETEENAIEEEGKEENGEDMNEENEVKEEDDTEKNGETNDEESETVDQAEENGDEKIEEEPELRDDETDEESVEDGKTEEVKENEEDDAEKPDSIEETDVKEGNDVEKAEDNEEVKENEEDDAEKPDSIDETDVKEGNDVEKTDANEENEEVKESEEDEVEKPESIETEEEVKGDKGVDNTEENEETTTMKGRFEEVDEKIGERNEEEDDDDDEEEENDDGLTEQDERAEDAETGETERAEEEVKEDEEEKEGEIEEDGESAEQNEEEVKEETNEEIEKDDEEMEDPENGDETGETEENAGIEEEGKEENGEDQKEVQSGLVMQFNPEIKKSGELGEISEDMEEDSKVEHRRHGRSVVYDTTQSSSSIPRRLSIPRSSRLHRSRFSRLCVSSSAGQAISIGQCRQDFVYCKSARRPVVAACPVGDLFDALESTCVPTEICGAEKVNLDIPSSTSSPILPSTSSSYLREGENPTMPIPTATIVHDIEKTIVEDSDCSSLTDGAYPISPCSPHYFVCSASVRHVYKCPEGLVYHKGSDSCEWPANVAACPGGASSDAPSSPVTASTENEYSVHSVNGDSLATTAPSTVSPMHVHFNCIKDGGFAIDCKGGFVMCSNGASSFMKCPQSLVFEESSQSCQYPAHVGSCGLTSVSVLDVPSTVSPVYNPSTTSSPAMAVETLVTTPVDKDACSGGRSGVEGATRVCPSSFVICKDGQVTAVMNCAEGTFFNEKTKTCDYRELACAGGWSGEAQGVESLVEKDVPTVSPVNESEEYGRRISRPYRPLMPVIVEEIAKKEEVKRDEVIVERPIVVPSSVEPTKGASCDWKGAASSSSCSSQFITCSNGRPEVMDCSYGLVFSSSSSACEYPQFVSGCPQFQPSSSPYSPSLPYAPSTPTTTSTPSPVSDAVVVEEDSSSEYTRDQIPSTTTVNPLFVPVETGDHTTAKFEATGDHCTFSPDRPAFPLNYCSMTFAVCTAQGMAYRTNCSFGFLFDSVVRHCVPSEHCGQPYIKDIAAGSPTSSPLHTLGGWEKDTRCVGMKDGSLKATALCSGQYIKCHKESVLVQTCSGTGRVFSPLTGRCVMQVQMAECSASPKGSTPAITRPRMVSPSPPSSDALSTPSQSYSTPLPPPSHRGARIRGGLPVLSSPTQFDARSFCTTKHTDGLYRNPENCAGIVQCFGGEAFSYPSCAPGLFFNEVDGQCDYASNVPECASQADPIALDDSSVSCKGQPHGAHLADDSDCSIYYRCVWGSLERLTCPDGTVFNPRLSVCDYPTEVPHCQKQ